MNIVGKLAALASLAAISLTASLAHADTPIKRTEVVMVDPILDMATPSEPFHHVSNVVWINRCIGGCTISPGGNDAINDTVSFIQSPVFLDEFMHDEETYQQVVDCVREVYLPYDVEIVTDEPAGPHHEAILAGTPEQMGLNPQVGGIAPAACSPIDNAISLTVTDPMSTPIGASTRSSVSSSTPRSRRSS